MEQGKFPVIHLYAHGSSHHRFLTICCVNSDLKTVAVTPRWEYKQLSNMAALKEAEILLFPITPFRDLAKFTKSLVPNCAVTGLGQGGDQTLLLYCIRKYQVTNQDPPFGWDCMN